MFAINLSARRAVSHSSHPSFQFSPWHCQALAFLCSAAKSSFFITFPGRPFTGIHLSLPHKFTLYSKLATRRSEGLARSNYYKEVVFLFWVTKRILKGEKLCCRQGMVICERQVSLMKIDEELHILPELPWAGVVSGQLKPAHCREKKKKKTSKQFAK